MSRRIGLISGSGKFPLLFAQAAHNEGYEVVAIAHEGETSPDLEQYVEKIYWVKLGQLGKLINSLKRENIKEAVMAGGIDKKSIYGKIRPDMRALMEWAKLRNRLDDGILRALASILEEEGITVRESTLFLKSIMAPKGVLSKRKPSESEEKDIEFGWRLAKEIGRLDIGQCVVVKNLVVLAVEAIEGTDETIRRGGRLGKDKAVIVKILKPQQDLRFDLPAVGLQTIRTMAEVNASCLALEAGKVLIFEKELMLAEADQHKMALVAL